nr:hypothetical protein [Nocardia terpenica]
MLCGSGYFEVLRAAQRLGQIAFDGALGDHVVQESEEGGARVVGLGEGAGMLGHALDAIHDGGVEQRLLGGEVPVDGAGPDARAPGDLVQRHRDALGGKGFPSGREDTLAIAAGIGAQHAALAGRRCPFLAHGTSLPGISLTSGAVAPNNKRGIRSVYERGCHAREFGAEPA